MANIVSEITSRRTRHSKHYRLDDGRGQGVFSEGIHYQAADGILRIPNRTFRQVTASEWIIDESDVRVRVYSTGAGGKLVWWFEMTGLISNAGIRFRLPSQPTVSGSTVKYTDANGLEWTYTVTAKGSKLVGPPISTKLGSRTFTFNFEYVGAPPTFTAQTNGSLSNGEITIPQAKILGADGQEYYSQSWTVPSATSMSFVWDDTSLPAAALPYRVDPSTTFALATSTDGQIARKKDTVWPPGGAVVWFTAVCYARKTYAATNTTPYFVDCGLLKWDTSSIPAGATINSCDHRIYLLNKADFDTDRNWVAHWYQWDGVTGTDHIFEVPADLFSVDLTTLPEINTYMTVPIASTAFGGIATGVGAVTYMRTGITGSHAPGGANVVRPWDVDDGVTNDPPQLIVTYNESTNNSFQTLNANSQVATNLTASGDWLIA